MGEAGPGLANATTIARRGLRDHRGRSGPWSPRQIREGDLPTTELGWPGELFWPALCSLAPTSRLHASRRAAKQAVFCVYKPKAPFKPVFEVATTRKDSEVALVHDPEAEPRIADQPSPHGHGLEADSCLWWRRGRVELYCEHGNSVLVAA